MSFEKEIQKRKTNNRGCPIEGDMNLNQFDGKCVRIITSWGEVFEGVVSYDDKEYAFHEYGHDQEALRLTPIIFFKNDIVSVISLEDVNGPFGHYSEKYGLLEKKCLEWGTDLIEEVFETEDDSQILRMLACMKDDFQTLADRAVPGIAPWRSGKSIPGSTKKLSVITMKHWMHCCDGRKHEAEKRSDRCAGYREIKKVLPRPVWAGDGTGQ